MNLDAALHSRTVAMYGIILGGVLLTAGVVLAVLSRVFRKDVRLIWKTYLSWCVMAPVVIGMVVLGRVPIIVTLATMAVLGFKEFARATGLYRDWWMTGGVYVAIIAVGVAVLMPDPYTHFPGWFGLFMALPVFAVAFIMLIPILRNRTAGQVQALALSIMGFIYFGWMFLHLAYLANVRNPYGHLLYLMVAVELNDVAAFTFGRIFGKGRKHPLRSNISPGKTWEGSLGALGVSMALPWLLRFSFPNFGALQLFYTGLIVGVGGQLGDLSISVIKRDIGVKDMGASIPGHGGILDRIDSLIYAAPLYFHMVSYFGAW